VDVKIKILIIATAIPLLIFLWPSFLGGNTDFLITEGNSMLPTILPGSMVITKKQPSYELDDIVAYHLKEGVVQKIVVHRIIEETTNGFILQGDNNKDRDPGVYKNDQIIGKVVFATPYVGYVLLIIRNPIVMVISSILLIIVQAELKKRKKRTSSHLQHAKSPISTRTHAPSVPPSLKIRQSDYRLFFVASAINILVYILQQLALTNKKVLTGDLVTGALYNFVEASIASTVAFSVYFFLFVLLYFLSRQREQRISVGQHPHLHSYLAKNRMLKISKAVWLSFILLGILHIISIIL